MARGNFGERLKRERELREVTLEEITAHTRIGPRFLEALENEDWDKLPGGVFNRGFVRSVARYLGLDEESLLGEYDLAHGTPIIPTNERQEDRISSPPKWIPLAITLGAILLLILLLVGGRYAWRYFATRRAMKPAPTSSLTATSAADSRMLLLQLKSAANPSLATASRSGTIALGHYDPRQASRGNSQS
ncbi:MAG: helix-turn-helix transcriptional regulator [Candidatus Acidiferrum sp.]